MTKYKLTGRYMEGIKIIGFQLLSEAGEASKVKRETVEKMAEQELITNCKVIKDSNKVYLRGIGVRISELPILNISDSKSDSKKSTMEIVGRLIQGTELVGYLIRESTGTEYRISKEKAWTLTMEGVISNAEARISGENKLILGKGVELRKLPSIQTVEH